MSKKFQWLVYCAVLTVALPSQAVVAAERDFFLQDSSPGDIAESVNQGLGNWLSHLQAFEREFKATNSGQASLPFKVDQVHRKLQQLQGKADNLLKISQDYMTLRGQVDYLLAYANRELGMDAYSPQLRKQQVHGSERLLRVSTGSIQGRRTELAIVLLVLARLMKEDYRQSVKMLAAQGLLLQMQRLERKLSRVRGQLRRYSRDLRQNMNTST